MLPRQPLGRADGLKRFHRGKFRPTASVETTENMTTSTMSEVMMVLISRVFAMIYTTSGL